MKRVSLMNKSIRLMFKLHQMKIPVLPKIINNINRIIFACDIPPSVSIGRDTVFIHSGLGVVVHSKAIIGSKCKIYQGVTIGGRGEKGTPIIEDNVFIGANSTIIGNIKVGSNSTIGANSLVLKDVPEDTIVGGNPAKILGK